jgi:hypothetical protein
MANPPNISLEIGQQLLQRLEHIRILALADMAVIALARLVVVSKYALSADNIRKAVLEQVLRPFERGRQLPDHDLSERGSRVGDPATYQFDGLRRREV